MVRHGILDTVPADVKVAATQDLQTIEEGLRVLIGCGYLIELPRCPVCHGPMPSKDVRGKKTCSMRCRQLLKWQQNPERRRAQLAAARRPKGG